MDFSFMPSLKYVARRKVIITLWNQEDIRAFIAKIDYEFPNDLDIKCTIEKVIEKIPQLSLPESLKKKLIYLAKPIGLEILTWRRVHASFLPKEFVEASLGELCWTQLGIVDRKSTAEVLIRNENTDITIRYKLACIYCLEHDIRVLWDKIPEHLRNDFYREVRPMDMKQGLVVLWTYKINWKLAKLVKAIESKYKFRYNPCRYTFMHAIPDGNNTAAEYFLYKIAPEFRKEVLLQSLSFVVFARADGVPFPDVCGPPGEHYSRALYFLLSQMTEKQQKEVLERYHCGILRCFLDWPLHNIFMRIVKSVWTSISEDVYYNLLCMVVRKGVDGSKDFNYRGLFGELWAQGQTAHIKYVINKSLSTCELLLNLILVEDERNILLILKDVSIQEKYNLIFSDLGKDMHKALVIGRRWKMLQFFNRAFISSKSTEYRFTKEFREHIFHGPGEMPEKMDIWNNFLRYFHSNQQGI